MKVDLQFFFAVAVLNGTGKQKSGGKSNFLTKDIQENNTEKRGSYELCFFIKKIFKYRLTKIRSII